MGVAGANGDSGTNLITIGANGVVTLGTDANGVNSDTGSVITVTGDTYGTGSGNVVTLNKVVSAGIATKAIFFAAGVENAGINVDVASATTWAQAANIAVTIGTNGGAAGNNYYTAFNWTDGNTYVIGRSGAAETALLSADIVVKLTGLATPGLAVVAGHTIDL